MRVISNPKHARHIYAEYMDFRPLRARLIPSSIITSLAFLIFFGIGREFIFLVVAPSIFVILMHFLTSTIHLQRYIEHKGKALLINHYFFGTFFYPYNRVNSLLLDLNEQDLRDLQFWGKWSGWATLCIVLCLFLRHILIFI